MSTSLLQCYTDGRFDSTKFIKLRRHDSDIAFEDAADMLLRDQQPGKSNDPPTQEERKKRQKRIILAKRTEDGEMEEIPPTESLWYHAYITCPHLDDSRFHQKFRRRFRLPYSSFLDLVEDAREGNWFPRWTGKDATGKESSPLELLILGAFRYLGRGFTFDDLEECTAISEEVHRVFFHKFITIGSTILYDKYVSAPLTNEDVEGHMDEFKLAGLTGAFASSDATHILHEMCAWRLRRMHKGGKSKYPTRTYNITVNHRRRILGTTRGHPGSWNDKTLVLFDTFIKGIKRGDILDDYEFELMERRGDTVVPVKYRGVWIVVDNGYHAWSITVPPFTNTNYQDEIRWSEWVESMRKDVECTFGILKGRWRVLKTGVRLQSTESVDKIWCTCCAFHNMLLEIDGLDEPWDGIKVPTSIWDGEAGDLESEDVPLAVRRALSPATIRDYDTSSLGVGRGGVRQDEVVNKDGGEVGEGGIREVRVVGEGEMEEVRVVRNLSLKYFRSKLVEHFGIMWKSGKVFWPRRRGNAPRAYFEH